MLSIPAILLASAQPPPPVVHADLRLDFTAALRTMEPARGVEPDRDADGDVTPGNAELSVQPEPTPHVPFHRLLETGGARDVQRLQLTAGSTPRLFEAARADLNVPNLAELARQSSGGLPFGLQISIEPHCW